jgi:hypothetical protein
MTVVLERCIYDEGPQIEIIDELINRITHQHASHRDSHPNVLKASLGKVFADAVIGLGAFFKDGAFREEGEWRLVTNVKSYRDTSFRFRTGKSMLIPYYSLKVGNGSWRDKIASVTIGPCPHPEISQMAVSGLLVSQYVTTEVWLTSPTPTHPPVNISKIPYRSW